MKRLVVILTVFGLFLAACVTPGGPVIVEVTKAPSPTPTPANIPAVQAALDALAAQLGLPAGQVKVIKFEPVEWSDSCLGIVRIDALCAQGVVPGYRVILEANGKQHEFHTNGDGTVVVLAPAIDGAPMLGDLPAAVQAAINNLMQQLNLTADQIKVISFEEKEWPDGCLGVRKVGVMCTQQIVPGFLVVLEANGKQYEFHTNVDGSVVLPADGVGPVVAPASLVKAATEALARVLSLNLGDIRLVSVQLVDWPDSCLGIALPGAACAQVVTPGYLIVLEANGKQFEYHTNADGSVIRPASLALVWQRMGGIAGFCDTLVLFRTGEAHGDWCKPQAGSTDTLPAVLLTADEQNQLNDWLAKYGMVSITQADPADVSDAMSVTLTLYGSGSEQPTEAEQRSMVDFATNVYTRIKQ
jgi:hypothetical protein